MVAFEWIPTIEEVVRVVGRIFEELTSQECEHLVQELYKHTRGNGATNNTLNIAFFRIYGPPFMTILFGLSYNNMVLRTYSHKV
jgi:hypothetical protein